MGGGFYFSFGQAAVVGLRVGALKAVKPFRQTSKKLTRLLFLPAADF